MLNMVGLVVLTFFMITLTISRTLSEDVPEFQYPCYVDVCTFPTQYCNSERYERRCNPCSRAICRQTNVPLACRYICLKQNELTTTLKPTTITSPQARHGTDEQNDSGSVHLIMIYSAISSTMLVVTLLSFIAYYIHRKKVSKEKRTKTQSQTIHYRTNTRTCSVNNLFQEGSLENQGVCHYCGHSPRPENLNIHITENSVGPPSYRTYDQGRPVFTTGSPSDSTDSVPSSTTKTVLVKPLASVRPPANVNKNKAACNANDISDSSVQTQEIESLLDSNEANDTEETSRKGSNI